MRASLRLLRPAALLALGLAVAALSPRSPGVTYRIRIVNTPPEIPGMPPQPPVVIVARGWATEGRTRMEYDSVSGSYSRVAAPGQFILTLDSGRVATVDPATRTYTDARPGMDALPADVMSSAALSNVSVTSESLGPGETIEGYATEKIRVLTSYSMNMMGQTMSVTSTQDMWLAKVPLPLSSPFDPAPPKAITEGPMGELLTKTAEANKVIAGRTALKTMMVMSINGPMSLTTTSTTQMFDIKAGEVDPALLRIPEGFTRKP